MGTVSHGITLERSFGYKNAHRLFTLPMIQLLFSSGHFAVAIFSLVSGYGLSIKPVGIKQQEMPSCLLSFDDGFVFSAL
ncbi:hypothetical protein Ct61P_15087 [Colletotrichum tofieldiae]|nr:hypothetical protein Ct61P_15087 [Colletotrichum tofieldiae]